jgi:hypothetical protein
MNPLRKQTITPNTKMGELIGFLMYLTNCSHIAHLKTNSFAQHKATEDLYSNFVDAVDTLAESTMGLLGQYNIISPGSTFEEPIDCINEGIKQVQEYYKYFPETWIQNQLDELLTLLYQTRYKISFLK